MAATVKWMRFGRATRLVRDDAEQLRETVADCRRHGRTIAISGHGSKAFLGAPAGDVALSLRKDHFGIVDYRPEELVLTALGGTPLAEVAQAVAAEGQLLPFDPPRFGGAGTFGGAIASGLAGPGRPWRGGVRDAVLGVEMVGGRGERMRFGGSVMKNVAGYDVSRLMSGSRGVLGLILGASVRLLPTPETEQTYTVYCDAAASGALTRRWARLPLPVTATCYVDGALHVRLSGSASSVASARTAMNLRERGDDSLWAAVRDHEHGFFAAMDAPLTRLSLPRGCAFADDEALIEWGGCQAWLRREPERLPAGAVAMPFRGGAAASTPDAATAKYTARLKTAFDPEGIFNPGLAL